MKKILLALYAALLVGGAQAAPFVVSDPVDPATAQCGVLLDAAPKVIITVTVAAGVKTCKYDLATLASGSHSIRMTAITLNDPVWGSQESAPSVPLAFSKPAVPAPPASLVLSP